MSIFILFHFKALYKKMHYSILKQETGKQTQWLMLAVVLLIWAVWFFLDENGWEHRLHTDMARLWFLTSSSSLAHFYPFFTQHKLKGGLSHFAVAHLTAQALTTITTDQSNRNGVGTLLGVISKMLSKNEWKTLQALKILKVHVSPWELKRSTDSSEFWTAFQV